MSAARVLRLVGRRLELPLALLVLGVGWQVLSLRVNNATLAQALKVTLGVGLSNDGAPLREQLFEKAAQELGLGAIKTEYLNFPVLEARMTIDPAAPAALGRTSLAVSRLGFGTGPFGNLLQEASEPALHEATAAALAAGVRYFDTAPFYGHGLAEHRAGETLRGVARSRFVLSTKVGRLLAPNPAAKTAGPFAGILPFDVVPDYSYEGTLRSLADSMQRLGLASIDIALIHDINPRWQGAAFEQRYAEAMAGAYRALDRLRAEGAIKAIGVGVNDVDVLLRCARDANFDCFMLAGRYTLLDHTALPALLPECARRQISVLLAAPYNSGILATGARPGATFWYSEAPPEIMERVRRIEAVCRRHDVPLPAAALQFPFGHAALASVVAGLRSAEEVSQAVAWMRHAIPHDLWRELRHERLIDQAAPLPGGQ